MRGSRHGGPELARQIGGKKLDHVDVFEIIGEGPASSAIVDAMIITSAKIRNYDKPLLSISGGSDSDIMLDMCWRLDPLKKLHTNL